MSQYLFVLGSHLSLSVAELQRFVALEQIDETSSVALGTVKLWPNPRNLPKSQEGLLQDHLGGCIRFGEVLGVYEDWDDLVERMKKEVPEEAVTPRFRLGFSTFGESRHAIRQELLDIFQSERDHCRFINPPKENLTSARIFEERLLTKGIEFLVWFQGDRYILAQTVANQNIRNYTVRDRKKEFRDAHMGMLPPKLAQMMLNICLGNEEATPQDGLSRKSEIFVWDPFCGSGTINIEAILMGHKNYGSDLDADRVKYAQENYIQMAEHFRFDPSTAVFFDSDAGKISARIKTSAPQSLWVVTEGYLGKNFRNAPTAGDIQESKKVVLSLWAKVFEVWEKLGVEGACFCLPNWQTGGRALSVVDRVMEYARKSGYKLVPLDKKNTTYVYSREGAHVRREILKVVKI